VLTMSMGRKKKARQASMFVAKSAALRGPRHRFYEALEKLLREADFDREVEALCSAYYEKDGTLGRRSIPPGVYFRMLLIGFFEGIEAERGICWRCEDSLSLRSFLGLELDERVPEHSTLSRTRDRLPTEVYEAVFDLVLGIVDEHGLLNGKVAGVDSTYLRADASMKSIVRRDTGDGYNAYLARLANDAGVQEPTAEDLRRMDRTRKAKRTSNKHWESPVDGDARIARMKDGTTRLAHKAEHVVDMESGAVVHADVLDATTGDASSIVDSVGKADERLSHVRNDDDDDAPGASSGDEPRPTKHIKEVCGDKGYHKAITIRELQRRGVRTYIPERKQKGQRRFTDKGGWFTARAVYANRARSKPLQGQSAAAQAWRIDRKELCPHPRNWRAPPSPPPGASQHHQAVLGTRRRIQPQCRPAQTAWLRNPARVRKCPRGPLRGNSRALGYHPSCERRAVVPATYPQLTSRYAQR
jgi:transposase